MFDRPVAAVIANQDILAFMRALLGEGRGVLKLLGQMGGRRSLFPVYIGDDRTDEDAFRALNENGLTIRVGTGRRTAARCRLRGVDEVWKLLAAIGLPAKGRPAERGALTRRQL